MQDSICVNITKNHIYDCSVRRIGRKGENISSRFEIILDNDLVGLEVFMEFKKPNGETLVTPRLDLIDNVATYDIPLYLLDTEGELKAQIVLRDTETMEIWKTYVKKYYIDDSICASDDIPNKEDWLTNAQRILDDIEDFKNDIDEEVKEENSNLEKFKTNIEKEVAQEFSNLEEFKTDMEKEVAQEFSDLEEYKTNMEKELMQEISNLENEVDNELVEIQSEIDVLKEQFPSGVASGNVIYLDDSSDMELSVNKISGGYKQDTSIEPCLETPSEIETVNNSIAVNITNFEKDQIQSLVIPIQQEMLDGDYIADVEHHEWGKLILTGNEDFAFTSTKKYITLSSTKTEQLKDAYIEIEDSSNNVTPLISNNYVGGTQLEVTTAENIIAFTKWGDIIYLYFNALYEQLSEFRTILKTKYENGTPVIIYYKLQDAIDLELNEEQKAVKEKKLYTYKNITNINLDDELASVDVSYKKDINIVLDKLQTQINELLTN